MVFRGDPLFKRVIQAGLKPLGYKIVQTRGYDARMGRNDSADRPFNKLFCIGFNKTGTTSLERVLLDWGLRMPKQLEQEDILSDVVSTGDYCTLKAFCQDFDAFQDLPFSQSSTFLGCDALFPGSRFILTVRDPKLWVDSYIRYYKKAFDLEHISEFSEEVFRDQTLYLKSGYIHSLFQSLLIEHQGGKPIVRWDLAFDRDFLMALYLRRNSEIRAYFSRRPNDLLEFDLSLEPDTGRLQRFVGIEAKEIGPFPTENVNRK